MAGRLTEKFAQRAQRLGKTGAGTDASQGAAAPSPMPAPIDGDMPSVPRSAAGTKAGELAVGMDGGRGADGQTAGRKDGATSRTKAHSDATTALVDVSNRDMPTSAPTDTGVASPDLESQKGIGAAPFSADRVASPARDILTELPLDQIEADPNQPRRDLGNLTELSASIQEVGLVQPIIVSVIDYNRYRIIAGERRYSAAKLAGRLRVPAIVRTLDEHQRLAVQLIENLHRKDLNPFEEAESYRRLMDEFGLSQSEVGKRLGKSQESINETLRILTLPESIRREFPDAVAQLRGKVSGTHSADVPDIPDAQYTHGQTDSASTLGAFGRGKGASSDDIAAQTAAAGGAATSKGAATAGISKSLLVEIARRPDAERLELWAEARQGNLTVKSVRGRAAAARRKEAVEIDGPGSGALLATSDAEGLAASALPGGATMASGYADKPVATEPGARSAAHRGRVVVAAFRYPIALTGQDATITIEFAAFTATQDEIIAALEEALVTERNRVSGYHPSGSS